jgi:hypothetical protein
MEKEILKKAGATITDEIQNHIKIGVANPTWLHRLHIKPRERSYCIKNITLGALMRISTLMLEIGFDPDNNDYWNQSLKSMAQDTQKMILICAHAISNSKKQPDQKLIDFLTDNMDSKSMLKTVMIAVKQLNVKAFTTSIISIKGVSLLNSGS